MRMGLVAGFVAFCLALWCASAFAAMEPGAKLEADGKVIDVRVGHLVPCVMDWNADGKKDLIVGQFSGGKIRLYLNQGSDSAPAFKDFSYLHAGTKEIHLPAG